MKHRIYGILTLTVSLLAAPAAAQSRVDSQIFLDLRLLQSQVQQLTLAVNALAEKVKGTDGRLETQANAMLKGFADQKLLIDAIAAQQRALNNGESDSAVRVLQLQQEMKTIRQGLSDQQTVLNEILALLQQPAAAAGTTGTDPATPPATGTPPRTSLAIPASPGAIYNNAMGYFYNGKFVNAIEALGDAIKRYPDSPDAAKAQLTIGDSYDSQGGHNQEALAAYALVIKNYKDADVVADAHYKTGSVYEKLGQKEDARKSYENVIKLFPNTTTAALATTALKRMGFIK